jgi:CubicO group peptidase (beta-lactamase class C family)
MRLPSVVAAPHWSAMKKHILTLSLLVAFTFGAEAHDAADCGAPAALDDGWSIATPAEAGFDPAKLCPLDALLETWPTRNIHSVVVARRGKLVMERHFTGPDERWGQSLGTVRYGPEQLHDVRSVSKSATSLLVGIALAEGKFPALDSPVFASFPEFSDLRTPEKDRITFRHLLTMSVGWRWEEDRPFSDPLNNESLMIAWPGSTGTMSARATSSAPSAACGCGLATWPSSASSC